VKTVLLKTVLSPKNSAAKNVAATLTPQDLRQALNVLSTREAARQSRLSSLTRLGRGGAA